MSTTVSAPFSGHYPTDLAVVTTKHRLYFDDLVNDTFGLRAVAGFGAPVAIASTDPALLCAAFVALDGWASAVYLLGHSVPASRVPEDVPLITEPAAADEQYTEVSDLDSSGTAGGDCHPFPKMSWPTTSDTAAIPIETQWFVYTSGTTGDPKVITHTMSTLGRTAVASASARALVWGLLYDPNRMAGIQVMLQALTSGATLVCPELAWHLRDRVAFMAEHSVSALSATPTMWRMILALQSQSDALPTDQSENRKTVHVSRLPLRQITLGGEIADQAVLDGLQRNYPTARVVHIFASTEAGAAFSVTDGLAGFPRSYLDNPERAIGLTVREETLHVHSPGVSAAGSDGYVSTGDVVEIVDDRVIFRGRATGVVNIGGANVWPEEVENLIRSHTEVADAVVTPRANPMSGHILVATIAPISPSAAEGLGKRVRLWLRGQVPNTHVPAIVKVVDELEVSAAGKAIR